MYNTILNIQHMNAHYDKWGTCHQSYYNITDCVPYAVLFVLMTYLFYS